ncbi:MAG: PD-(D/E)XK nuclease family protein [Firmicutes bacterium]|nr:PD-(D/E)XK nuclease family protein [Bacillota bacterium]
MAMPKCELKIGVKELLESYFTPKDLEAAFPAPTRGQEGVQGHQLIRAQRPKGYRTEVPIELRYETAGYRLTVKGRIDGFIETEDEILVEEIKTTYTPLREITPGQYPAHQAQLKLYLYFVMAQNPEQPVIGRLTYLNLDDLSERSFPLAITLSDGEEFFNLLAENYLDGRRNCDTWRQIRNRSLNKLFFPYTSRRPGQDELMDFVTQAIEQERDLFAEAATGIGKTIAVLYPSLKQLAVNQRFQQIFFLTAKTAGKEILKKTLDVLMKQGLKLRTVFIEAKERVCATPGVKCRSQACPYTVDYFSKAKRLIPELLGAEMLTWDLVSDSAKREGICPFELSLDLALQADLIVCDYNYVFDPGVYLRRFFEKSSRRDYLFLVDEAHNLVSRGREMFSAALSQQELAKLQASLGKQNPYLAPACAAVLEYFQAWGQELEEQRRPGILLGQLPEMLEPALERLVATLELTLKQNLPPALRDQAYEHYFNLTAFTRLAATVTRDYAIYTKKEGEEPESSVSLRLFCLNPGPLLRERLNHGRVAIFFSATLSPSEYFQELLGGGQDSLSLRLASPFPKETRLYLHVPGIDTRYKSRNHSAGRLAQCIVEFVTAHTGNYLIFFPSYQYLQIILPLVKPALSGKARVYTQNPAMSEAQKQEFLSRVTGTGGGKSNVGFAVLGGVFGEGVDLPGEKLIGALIVGPGIPVVSDEQELIRLYFEERNGQGFLYAYLIPGLIRVIQSAGRVFRSPDDQGAVLLVDDRFLDENCQALLPPDWFLPGRPFSTPDYQRVLREFWQEG